MAKQASGRLAQVTGKDVTIDPAEHYDGWAKSYDHDLLNEYGYSAHKIAVAAFATHVTDTGVSIIDVGCGTGLVAIELRQLGFQTIDGVDISEGMLAEAKKTGIYRNLILQNVEKASAVPDGTYDALICVGSFGVGHLPPTAMADLARMVKPGAPIVIFMNAEPYIDEDYASHIAAMEKRHIWSVHAIEDHNYMSALDRPGKLIIAERSTFRDSA